MLPSVALPLPHLPNTPWEPWNVNACCVTSEWWACYACRFLTCSTPCIHFCSYSPNSLSQLSPLKPPAQLHMQVLSSRVPPFWHTLLQTARINMYLSIGVSFSLTHNCQDTLHKQLRTVGRHTVNYKMHRGYNTCISNCLTSNLVHKFDSCACIIYKTSAMTVCMFPEWITFIQSAKWDYECNYIIRSLRGKVGKWTVSKVCL